MRTLVLVAQSVVRPFALVVFIFGAAWLGTRACAHEAHRAIVRSVYDCDTLSVTLVTLSVGGENSTVPAPVRVRGVSAPERTGTEKPLGLACRADAIAQWLKPGDTVTLIGPFTWDPRRRLVARVLLPDGRDLGAELVRLGYAKPWDYPHQERPVFDPSEPYPLEVGLQVE